jgi:hypothetical protein
LLLRGAKDNVKFGAILRFRGRDMVQAVNRLPFTAEVQVQCQVSPCKIYDGVKMGEVFLQIIRGFPVIIISPFLHTHLHQSRYSIYAQVRST